MNTTAIRIQLITAPGCSKCVAAKQAVLTTLDQVRADYRITLEEVSAFEHPEVMVEHGILATPALIIDGELAFVGRVKETALREKLAAIS